MNKNAEIYKSLFLEMINKIQQRIKLNAVILFGSRARGDFIQMSDYDIVVVGAFQEPYFERLEWVGQLAPDLAIDLFCYTLQEFETLFSSYNLTTIDAIGEGFALYGEDFFRKYHNRYNEFVKHGMRKSKCALYPPLLK
jgi:predicted nucleotidyltransferase